MGRVKLMSLVLVSVLPLLILVGCSESEVNPFDPSQDQTPPSITGFIYSGGEAQWSTDEDALCVVEYGPVDGDFIYYAYESTKYFTTYHSVTLLGAEDGVEYKVRVRCRDRAGNEGYQGSLEPPADPTVIVGHAVDSETMTLSMIDVGWGLSMVMTTPDGSNILIDAASYEHLQDIFDFLQEHFINSFDAVVATHYHGDHAGGFEEDSGILDTYGIGEFVGPNTATAYIPLPSSIESKLELYDIPFVSVKQGDDSENMAELDWDDTPGFKVEVLGAGYGGLITGPEDDSTEGMKGNNDSIVMRFTFHGVSYITTGDAEFFTEYRIITHYGRQGSKADLVQVAHHGNDDATSELWLDNVSPRVALISNAMIEAQLEKEVTSQGIRAVDADYFVTDRVFPNTPRNVPPVYGNLIAVTDGETVEVQLERHGL